jgi:hypothetical protein
MVYRKGERTKKQREAEYPFAVDIPIVGNGLGQNIGLIDAAAKACKAGAETWSTRTRAADGTPTDWRRIGTKAVADAESIAGKFSYLNARRVR